MKRMIAEQQSIIPLVLPLWYWQSFVIFLSH